MKVADYVRRNEAVLPPELAALVLSETHIWSNEVCCGYCVAAMKNAGFDHEQIHRVMRGMHQAFDELTIEDAEAVYQRW